jgi:hypothetical protein
MKLRPQFQLRFRDAEQFLEFKKAAQRKAVSMNEYILGRLESGNRRAVEAASILRSHQEALSKTSGFSGNAKCETHSLEMADFGNKWVCEGPPQHTVPK